MQWSTTNQLLEKLNFQWLLQPILHRIYGKSHLHHPLSLIVFHHTYSPCSTSNVPARPLSLYLSLFLRTSKSWHKIWQKEKSSTLIIKFIKKAESCCCTCSLVGWFSVQKFLSHNSLKQRKELKWWGKNIPHSVLETAFFWFMWKKNNCTCSPLLL